MSIINKEPSSGETYSFLAGGGEMGELTRKKDWSKTPLGTPGTWPQSLRTTLSILLNSKFPMFLFWGSESICFYNDAYRPSLGNEGKHPAILGSRAQDFWQEIWPSIKPLIDKVLAGGDASWSEDQLLPIYRNGKMEDVYWTFSYSPVQDESGKPAGVFVTCNETTEKVLTHKKLEENERKLRLSILQAPVAIAIFRGSDYVVEIVNPLALELWDRNEEDVINKPILKAIPELQSQGIEELLDNVYNTGSPFSAAELPINITRKGKPETVYISFVYEAVYDVDGKINGVMTVGTEVTAHVLSRKKTEESEEKFRTMAESSDILIGVNNESIDAVYFNKAWATLTGRPIESLLKLGWADLLHPDDRQPFLDKFLYAYKNKESYSGEFRVLNKDGEYSWLYANVQVRLHADGSYAGHISSSMDITERKHAEQQRKKSEAALKDSEQYLRSLVESATFPIGVYTGKDMRIQLVNKSILDVWGKTRDVIGKKYADVLPELAGQGIYEQLDKVLTTGIPFHAHNQRVDLLAHDMQPHYFNYSFTPLLDTEGNIYGVLNTAAEVTDLVIAKQKIEESEKEFRQLADSLPVLVWTTDSEGKQTFASKRWKEYTGLDPYDETTFEKMIHPDDLEGLLKIWSDCLATGTIYKSSVRLKSKDNEYQWFYVHGEAIKNEYGEIEKWVGAFTNFNEQKKAEEELVNAFLQIEESEKRFRNVANSVPVFIWMAGTDRLRNFFNTAWLNFTGRSFEQEKGNGWAEGVHPEDFKRCIHLYHTAFDKQEEFYMEYRLRRFDGEYRWVSAKGVPRFTADAVFEGFIGACMDIHERVVYQKKLKEDEERLNIIINASELGAWELNIKTNEVHYSDRYLEILGFENSPFLTHAELLTHLHPDDLGIRAKAFEEAFTTGILQYETRLIWDDHSVHWMQVKGKVFYDENNNASQLIGTVRDITEEKYYQQELLDREQKFRLLADSMPQMVWTGDIEGNLNYFNQSVYNYSGITPQEMKELGWLQIVHSEDREENISRWTHSIKTGEDFLFEHRFRRSDGEFRWQLSRAIPQKDAAGNIQMWVGTSTDVQDMKEQDQQKDFFISMASHELKTPLTSIKGYVQVLKSVHSNSEDTQLKKALTTIDKQIVTLTDLISAMLDLSKIKTGSLSLNKEHFTLNELILEIVEDIQQINTGHRIIFLEKNNPNLYADRNRIGQVLINFLTNAVKYSPQYGEIKVETAIEDGEAKVSVIDHGIGINEKDQKKIFERFYRAEGKNEKRFPGFGIGLFIAADIIHKHEGKIGVSSEPGKGSVFYFSIPTNQL